MRLRQPVTGEVARIAPPNIPEHCLRLSAKLLSLRSALPVRVASLFRQTRCAWQGVFASMGSEHGLFMLASSGLRCRFSRERNALHR
jgi:hypothetical protein